MLKKVLEAALSSIIIILIILILSANVMAVPYKELKIGEGATVIEAIWFDGGSDNYYESNPNDGNHDCRPEEKVQTYDYTINNDYADGRDTDTPSCIGWISGGEWVQYTIQAEAAGTYQVDIWGAAGPGGDLEAYCDGKLIGSVYIEDEGGWHWYALYPVGTVHMTAGTHIIKTEFVDGGINVESIVFTLVAAGNDPPPAPVTAAPTTAPAARAAVRNDGDGDENNAAGIEDEDTPTITAVAVDDESSYTDTDIFIIIGAVILIAVVVIVILVKKR